MLREKMKRKRKGPGPGRVRVAVPSRVFARRGRRGGVRASPRSRGSASRRGFGFGFGCGDEGGRRRRSAAGGAVVGLGGGGCGGARHGGGARVRDAAARLSPRARRSAARRGRPGPARAVFLSEGFRGGGWARGRSTAATRAAGAETGGAEIGFVFSFASSSASGLSISDFAAAAGWAAGVRAGASGVGRGALHAAAAARDGRGVRGGDGAARDRGEGAEGGEEGGARTREGVGVNACVLSKYSHGPARVGTTRLFIFSKNHQPSSCTLVPPELVSRVPRGSSRGSRVRRRPVGRGRGTELSRSRRSPARTRVSRAPRCSRVALAPVAGARASARLARASPSPRSRSPRSAARSRSRRAVTTRRPGAGCVRSRSSATRARVGRARAGHLRPGPTYWLPKAFVGRTRRRAPEDARPRPRRARGVRARGLPPTPTPEEDGGALRRLDRAAGVDHVGGGRPSRPGVRGGVPDSKNREIRVKTSAVRASAHQRLSVPTATAPPARARPPPAETTWRHPLAGTPATDEPRGPPDASSANTRGCWPWGPTSSAGAAPGLRSSRRAPRARRARVPRRPRGGGRRPPRAHRDRHRRQRRHRPRHRRGARPRRPPRRPRVATRPRPSAPREVRARYLRRGEEVEAARPLGETNHDAAATASAAAAAASESSSVVAFPPRPGPRLLRLRPRVRARVLAEPTLHVLVHNAGVMPSRFRVTEAATRRRSR